LSDTAHRGSIFQETAAVLKQTAFPGRQFVLRIRAPRAAEFARPGSFAHVTCDAAIPLRRPLSIMRTDQHEGWIELLYKVVGRGLDALSMKQPGDELSVLAPIGNGFVPDPRYPNLIGIGGGVGIPPIVFLGERLSTEASFRLCVFMGSELPFPFETVVSRLQINAMPRTAERAMKLLESCGVPSRLASGSGIEGAHAGHVTDLARCVLEASDRDEIRETMLLACGPEPMLAATAELAREFGVPSRLALEEYMACGVGGCAGCTVLVTTRDGPAMKRVCVDGPVFDGAAIYPP
jgi:dihydroorotate dehydrogenase electron transfer subunit